MAAASSLFGTQEYDSVSVADICAEAKVAKRYFYDHFTDRGDLLLAVHGETNDWLLDDVAAAMPHSPQSIEELLRPIMRRLVELLRAYPERARIIYINAPRIEPRRRELLRSEADFFGRLLRPYLTRQPDDNPRYARTLLALVAGLSEIIIGWLSRGMSDDPAELAEHLTWLCCAVLPRFRLPRDSDPAAS
jgi:AcrR family transcriptional regulator